uniref:hypothetical protein n=1 Tax=Synechococcus sp. UW106 TaxID=368495 RepID=UPI000E0EB975|nr:hypothetical protein [Synechococcus sp. UW106]
MSAQPKNVPGAGTSECQDDWTIESLVREFASEGGLSRRKIAWLDQQVVRLCDHEKGILWDYEWVMKTEEEVVTGLGLQKVVESIPKEVFDDLEFLTGLAPEFDHLSLVTWLEAAAEIVDSIRGDRGWEYRHGRRSVMWMALDEHGVF